MAGKKHSTKPKLAAVAPDANDDVHDQKAIRKQNPLIGTGPVETLEMCACVLDLLSEFHCRTAASEYGGDVEAGETYVLWAVQHALVKQAEALQDKRSKEANHG